MKARTQVKKWSRAALAGALAVAAISAPGWARYEDTVAENTFSIGARAAYFIPEEDAADEVWFGGVQLRTHFTPEFALEGSIDYREEDFGQTEVQSYPVQASLLAYIISREPVNLFLLGGAGWYYTRVDFPSGGGDDTDHRFGPHAGAGIQFLIDDQ